MEMEKLNASKLLSGLRKGCVCQIGNVQFAEYIYQGLELMHQNQDKKALLSFLTFLRSLAKFCFLLTQNGDEIVCKRLHSWLLLVRKIKFYLLKGLIKVKNETNLHVCNLAQDTLNHILTLVPCPMISEEPQESCQRLCQILIGKILTPSLAKFAFYDLENLMSKLKNGLKMNCSSAIVKVYPCLHYKGLTKVLVQNLRQTWKSSWIEKLSTSQDILFKHQILSLWKCLVDVKSNLTLHQMREFVSSVCLAKFKIEESAILKRKWLEIYNEILCYGSTLGIQSDVPGEVSEVTHQIVRLSKTEGINFKIPQVYLGLAGDKIDPKEDEKVPDLVTLQGVIMIHLKSVAILVREAQSCSSSDESDSSLTSRGSSSIAEEDREMKMIEKNVVDLLIKLRFWINDILGLPSSNSLNSAMITLFNEQDDGLVEALLCLLDAHSGLQFGSYSARIGISCGQEEDDSMDFFNPIDGFELFLSNISHDHSVLLDFLLSNETCFLLYFLRMIKYLNKRTQHSSREAILQTLKKVSTSIKKLTEKNLFPYDIRPVQKQLEKLFIQ